MSLCFCPEAMYCRYRSAISYILGRDCGKRCILHQSLWRPTVISEGRLWTFSCSDSCFCLHSCSFPWRSFQQRKVLMYGLHSGRCWLPWAISCATTSPSTRCCRTLIIYSSNALRSSRTTSRQVFSSMHFTSDFHLQLSSSWHASSFGLASACLYSAFSCAIR